MIMKKKILMLALAILYASTTQALNPMHDKVVRLIRDTEKTVLSAQWADRDKLVLTRKNDGTKQDGFADYICYSIKESGYMGRAVDVFILSHTAATNRGKSVILGKANCIYHLIDTTGLKELKRP